MASGIKHAEISKALAIPVCGITAAVTGDIALGVAAALGCFAGVPLSPDLDICGPTHPKNHMIRKWGLVGWVWSIYWLPYGRKMKHRYWLGHTPILGTTCRLAYLFLPLVVVGTAVWPELWLWAGWVARVPHTWAWVAGLAISDALHWIMDYW